VTIVLIFENMSLNNMVVAWNLGFFLVLQRSHPFIHHT